MNEFTNRFARAYSNSEHGCNCFEIQIYKYKNAYFFILVLFNPNTGNVMICDHRDVMWAQWTKQQNKKTKGVYTADTQHKTVAF